MQIKTRYHHRPIRMAQLWTPTPPNAGETWSIKDSHSLLVGIQNGTTTAEESLAISYKTKGTHPIQSSNHVPWYLPKGIRKLSPHINLNMNTDVYSSFILNCPSSETTRMSFIRWMDKQMWHIQTMQNHSVLKRNKLVSYDKMEEPWINII